MREIKNIGGRNNNSNNDNSGNIVERWSKEY
jgi:hypothetical protein